MSRVRPSWMRSSSIMRIRIPEMNDTGFSISFSSAGFSWTYDGNGIITLKQLPCPGVLSTFISPSWSSTNLRVIESPNPNPSCPCAPGRRVNSVNIFSCSALLIPQPVSSTLNVRRTPEYETFKVILPSFVNFRAFDNRFSTICLMRKGSPSSVRSCCKSGTYDSVIPFFSASGRKLLYISSISLYGRNATGLRSIFPASRR